MNPKITYRRIANASLDQAVNDPTNRNIMSMSTLIDSEQFLHEAPWDGMGIGDIQIFINENCSSGGSAMTDGNGHKLAPKWVWWGGVPRGKVKSYKFVDVSGIEPHTVGAAKYDPLEVDLSHAESQGELQKPSKASGARA